MDEMVRGGGTIFFEWRKPQDKVWSLPINYIYLSMSKKFIFGVWALYYSRLCKPLVVEFALIQIPCYTNGYDINDCCPLAPLQNQTGNHKMINGRTTTTQIPDKINLLFLFYILNCSKVHDKKI